MFLRLLRTEEMTMSQQRTDEDPLRAGWEAVAGEAVALRDGVRELKVATATPREEVRRAVERAFPLDRPMPLPEVVRAVAALLREHAVHVIHPRYFGLYNPSVRDAAALADALVALYNPQLAVWSHAAAAAELEAHALRRLGSALGREGDAATFTSGGAEANLTAALAALARGFPQWEEGGLRALSARPALYASAEAHHSLLKVARLTGLGAGALREVSVDARLRLDPVALERRIAEDRAQGFAPLLIAGTAGTTGAGVIDPLPALADVAARAGCWFHVDAAYGGTAALVPRLAPALSGIERADSVTWDAHKGLSVPMGAGMLFCRHAEALQRAFAATTSYMPSRAVEEPYASTIQWSRRAIGVKVLCALAEGGLAGAGSLFERQAQLGDRLRERLRGAGWEVVNDTPLPVVCFTHPDLRAGRPSPAEAVAGVVSRARAWISEIVLGGRLHALRACITSFHSDESDLDVLMEELERVRAR
jgi:glutamate/tyrosine decarboxylase-like PLP-dependent enzyme